MISAPETRTRASARGGPLSTSLLLLLLAGCGSGSPADEAPTGGLVILPPEGGIGPLPDDVRPRDYFHDFGEVPDGDSVEHVFRLRNEDAGPISITKINPDCACAVPTLAYVDEDGERVQGSSWSSDAEELLVIPPGLDAEVTIRVNTSKLREKNASRTLVTRVTTSSELTRYLTLEVSIHPVAPFQVVPTTMKFGSIAMSAGGERSVDVVPVGSSGTRIEGVREVPGDMEAEVALEVLFDQEIWILTGRYLPPLSPGLHKDVIVLDTVMADGEPGRPLEVPVVCSAVEDVLAEPAQFVARLRGADEGPAVAEVVLYSLLAGQRLKVVGIEPDEAHREQIEVEYEAIELDGAGRSARWRLRLLANRPLSGPVVRGTAVVSLDDAQTPRVEIPYVIHLR